MSILIFWRECYILISSRLAGTTYPASAAVNPQLGAACPFVMLGQNSVANTPNTVIGGNVGVTSGSESNPSVATSPISGFNLVLDSSGNFCE